VLSGFVTIAAFFYPEVIDPRLRNKKSESSAEFSCETLENREALYKSAAEVIGSAKSILDTTWGPEPSEPSPSELAARAKYLDAKRRAIRGGAGYCEIVSSAPLAEIGTEDSEKLKHGHPNFWVAALGGPTTEAYMIDFLVADEQQIIFSHVHSTVPGGMNRYLCCKCEPLAKLFAGLFRQCWDIAKEV
ncbi:MAG: hypothetical protein Q8P51_01270, partial [Ignavibacteria bacterium]|nr:hypothetical protein [Ignavibacteria bacterium]